MSDFNVRPPTSQHHPPPSTSPTSIPHRCAGIQDIEIARMSVQICQNNVLRRWEIRSIRAGIGIEEVTGERQFTFFRHHRHPSTHPSSNDLPLLHASTIVTLIPLDLRRPRHPSTSPPPLEDLQYGTQSLKNRIEVIVR
ncbi:hypothetical protein SISSUDRAFT_1068068 [Sistotremastrum suecicum HHB10207 ss-3]|uniref:Uncharacterized protein n=1 Tax=Sistotremastrum suecicum HHB10207 ss-3 TaxID=1314776 RepID=A0A165WGF7_9AGAM|nr:hypothetical protein SISSUDRAFT_1068068 [Sistotremastrum suecicum HHB10207 ss-3]